MANDDLLSVEEVVLILSVLLLTDVSEEREGAKTDPKLRLPTEKDNNRLFTS